MLGGFYLGQSYLGQGSSGAEGAGGPTGPIAQTTGAGITAILATLKGGRRLIPWIVVALELFR